jgi:hypothetical protein
MRQGRFALAITATAEWGAIATARQNGMFRC